MGILDDPDIMSEESSSDADELEEFTSLGARKTFFKPPKKKGKGAELPKNDRVILTKILKKVIDHENDLRRLNEMSCMTFSERISKLEQTCKELIRNEAYIRLEFIPNFFDKKVDETIDHIV